MAGRDPAHARNFAPVVVLTYAHSGVSHLTSLLAEHLGLACTTGTGMLPLCEQIQITWRRFDGSAATSATLASALARQVVQTFVTALCAREGKSRWCEVTFAAPSTVETFLRLFPCTRFISLHRSCQGVAHSALHQAPWGLYGADFVPFTLLYPSSSVTAVAAYWAAHAEALIAFEQSHQEICHRVRYEDLVANPGDTVREIWAFLGSESDCPALTTLDTPFAPAQKNAHELAPWPALQIPEPVLARVSDLMKELGY